MLKNILQLVCLAFACQLGRAATTPGLLPEIYTDWTNAIVLHGGDCKMVVVPAVGGRIISYALNGDNILYEESESRGKTLAETPGGFAMGGSYCDLGPEQRGLPDHKKLGLGPWTWKTSRPNQVSLQSEPDSGLGIELEKDLLLDPDSGEAGLQLRMRNISNGETSFCLWDRTLCKGGGFFLVPLKEKSRFKAGWALARSGANGKTEFDGKAPVDRRAKVLNHVLIVEAKGRPFKAGADSDAQWVAYAVGRLLLVKFFPVSPKGQYSDGGNSVEIACDDRRAEVGVLSPEVTLKPGESYGFPGKWVLYGLDNPVQSFSEARALVKRIPASPFKK
jgi:hypothetical protein